MRAGFNQPAIRKVKPSAQGKQTKDYLAFRRDFGQIERQKTTNNPGHVNRFFPSTVYFRFVIFLFPLIYSTSHVHIPKSKGSQRDVGWITLSIENGESSIIFYSKRCLCL